MVTPLQVAYTIGGIASGGEFKQPHLLKDAQNVGEKHVELAENNRRTSHARNVRRD